MMTCRKGLWIIIGLILSTAGTLVYMESQAAPEPVALQSRQAADDGLLSLHAALTQDKVLAGSDGHFSMALLMKAAVINPGGRQPAAPVDLVVVLDRSGSMGGAKINDAKSAIMQLSGRLTARDRLALVTYSNDMRTDLNLSPMDEINRQHLAAIVEQIRVGGGTNLGCGLRQGMNLLLNSPVEGRRRRLLLVSDGLANQGITDPDILSTMASAAVESDFSISSIGVGYDFNETLMTLLADHGGGRYYFLENPQAFAQVFEEEFQAARQVAASGLQLRIPLENGLRLLHAGGYPIAYETGFAVFHPGDLLSGQERRLFLTFSVPTGQVGETAIDDIQLRYQHQGIERTLTASVGLKIACVADPSDVTASVNEEIWSRQVLQEDYGRLKAAVAAAIGQGTREEAMAQIQSYETRTRRLNADVDSAAVRQNLDEDVRLLREKVADTFTGAPAAVESKRKQEAKTMQYDSYQTRRDK